MAFLAGGVAACGGTQRPVSDPRPEPGAVVSTLFDAGSVYGAMGLLVAGPPLPFVARSEEHTSELQSRLHLVCRLLLEKKKNLVTVERDSHGRISYRSVAVRPH